MYSQEHFIFRNIFLCPGSWKDKLNILQKDGAKCNAIKIISKGRSERGKLVICWVVKKCFQIRHLVRHRTQDSSLGLTPKP